MMSNASYSDEEKRQIRRRKRRMRLRRKKLRRRLFGGISVLLLCLMIGCLQRQDQPQEEPAERYPEAVQSVLEPEEIISEEPGTGWVLTDDTVQVEPLFPSEFVFLANMDTREIIACKNLDAKINPASMTKILTLLVAAENIKDVSGTFTMTFQITDYCYNYRCSVVGYEVGEKIPIEELFYGCILSSGADASLALAQVAAGSHEAFVDLMNAKLEELGLSETSHFTNCVGLYNKQHYCTVGDMAAILEAALKNEKCREVLSTKIYKTAATAFHPSGQDLSNWFIRRIEDQDTGVVDVRYGKTGYVPQSGYCAASGAVDEDGTTYLCVTGNSTSTWQSIYDHTALYQSYIG